MQQATLILNGNALGFGTERTTDDISKLITQEAYDNLDESTKANGTSYYVDEEAEDSQFNAKNIAYTGDAVDAVSVDEAIGKLKDTIKWKLFGEITGSQTLNIEPILNDNTNEILLKVEETSDANSGAENKIYFVSDFTSATRRLFTFGGMNGAGSTSDHTIYSTIQRLNFQNNILSIYSSYGSYQGTSGNSSYYNADKKSTTNVKVYYR